MSKLKNYINNILLCIKYPFLKVYNVWTGKFLGFSGTWYDFLDAGWRKAFGQEFLHDMRAALKKDHAIRKFRFLDIKEKYGVLEMSGNFTTDNIEWVFEKYNFLSMCYCPSCGKPTRYATKGWISFLCEDCFKQRYPHIEDIEPYRITASHIPEFRYFVDDKEIKIDIKEKYGVDMRALMGIEKEY